MPFFVLLMLIIGFNSFAYDIENPAHSEVRVAILNSTAQLSDEIFIRIYNLSSNEYAAIVWDTDDYSNAKVIRASLDRDKNVHLSPEVPMDFSIHGPHLDPSVGSLFRKLMYPFLYDHKLGHNEQKLRAFLREQSKSAVPLATGIPPKDSRYVRPCKTLLKRK